MPEDRWFVGCMLPDFPCCELAYEAGMPEDQPFWVPRRSRLFPGPRVCLPWWAETPARQHVLLHGWHSYPWIATPRG